MKKAITIIGAILATVTLTAIFDYVSGLSLDYLILGFKKDPTILILSQSATICLSAILAGMPVADIIYKSL